MIFKLNIVPACASFPSLKNRFIGGRFDEIFSNSLFVSLFYEHNTPSAL
jgi:hypothetical protein